MQPQPASREGPGVCTALQPSLLYPAADALHLCPLCPGSAPQCCSPVLLSWGQSGMMGHSPPQSPHTVPTMLLPINNCTDTWETHPCITVHHLHSQDPTTHIPGRKILLSTECLSASLWHCKNNHFWRRIIIPRIPNQQQWRPRPAAELQEITMPWTVSLFPL